MSEKIKITCPKCKTKWEKPLAELEKKEILYRGEEKKAVEYRDSCPVCGTYAIIKVQED
jgi:hypothetical protein